ncbi:hypothetical protein QBL02_00700 [Leucobacter sp. UT-8R-CII-1-4]|uniref:hypothetical protein n=1 Tax=Leucobacter sp. UT-8R-CII-1-4 TaxID=3040075 RepID=UPI0024A7B6D2|nr:hypothetical protein [Leucobacter sp. UT-8R-CII-1-4]MDI6022056.1 hypothetical protein [Leucobacter sp. UT-8R-CII-1-4]
MSEDREQAGSPVEQDETTETQVLAAVERAGEVSAPSAETAGEASGEGATTDASAESTSTSERPVIAAAKETPSAGAQMSAEEIFASHPPAGTAQRAVLMGAAANTEEKTEEASEDAALVETVGDPTPETVTDNELPPIRDGEIRISSDHPMAALYMQTPMPPEIRGNRGAGVLIALLATVSFAAVFAGGLALWLAPSFPPSTFFSQGLMPWVVNIGFGAAALGFFIGFTILVLIGGRAGWWVYAIFGLLVAAFTWGAALLGYALNDRFAGEIVSLQPGALLGEYGLILPVLIAAIVAREVTVWFGAWVGARGRRVKRQNAEAIEEYENALAEARTTQP